MGRRLIGTNGLALVAAGCSWTDDGSDAANAASNGIDYRQRVADMPEERRNALFLEAVVSAGLPCQQVEGATPGTDRTGTPVWTVHCRGGEDRTVIIAENGSARILDADPPAPEPVGNRQ